MKRLIPLALVSLIGACSESNDTSGNNSKHEGKPPADTLTVGADSHEVKKVETVDISPLTTCFNSVDGSDRGVPGCLEDHSDVLSSVSPELADSLIYISYQRLEEISERVPIDIDWEDAYDEDFNIRSEVAKPYNELGYHLDSEEGMFFIKPNWEVLGGFFEGKLTDVGEEYLRFKRDFRQKIAYDAGLVISPEEYADRLILQEKIMMDNPDFIWNQEIMENLNWELNWFFFGMDNTPSHDWESRTPLEGWMEAWKKAANQGGPVLQYYVNDWLDKVEAEGGKVPEMGSYPFINAEEFESKVENARW